MGPNTRRLVAEHGGFLYDADSYADELPYWETVSGKPHLVVPYTLEANDMRLTTAQGFGNGEHFFQYLKDSFDLLYAEGETKPRMMSVGLHCRVVGRPGRAQALARFLDYVQSSRARLGAAAASTSRGTGARNILTARPRHDRPPNARRAQWHGAGRVRGRQVGRGVRTFGLGRRRGCGRAGRSPTVAALHRAMVEAAASRRTHERKFALLIRRIPNWAPAKIATDFSPARAGVGRSRRDAARRRGEASRAQPRLSRAVWLSVHPRGQAARARGEILAALEERLSRAVDDEFAAALDEIAKIARFRLDALLSEGSRSPRPTPLAGHRRAVAGSSRRTRRHHRRAGHGDANLPHAAASHRRRTRDAMDARGRHERQARRDRQCRRPL